MQDEIILQEKAFYNNVCGRENVHSLCITKEKRINKGLT
jgi:hypothetical protein